MASIKLKGDTSGEVTISAPAVAGTTTLNLPATSSTLATQNALGVRNLIINGDMSVAQRATSYAGVNGNNIHTVDRWYNIQVNSGVYTHTQDSDTPDGFGKSLKIECTTASASLAASDFLRINQQIEAQFLQHLAYGTASAKTMTLSFWVKSNKTGTYGAWLYQPDGSRHIGKSYTINSADTWEHKTITIEGDTSGTINNDNGAGLTVAWYLAAGTDFTSGTHATAWEALTNANRLPSGQVNFADSTSNYINITGLQLEVGTEATPFEHRPYDMELARCERYYQKSYSYETVPATTFTNGSIHAVQFSWGSSNAGSIAGITVPFQTRMRNTPTLNIYDQAGNLGKLTTLDAGAGTTNNISPNQLVAGQNHIQLRLYNNSKYGAEFAYTVDAEL